MLGDKVPEPLDLPEDDHLPIDQAAYHLWQALDQDGHPYCGWFCDAAPRQGSAEFEVTVVHEDGRLGTFRIRLQRIPGPDDSGTAWSAMTPGQRLRALRTEYYGITQQELADRCGCSRTAVSFYERDKAIPDVVTALYLCRAFNVRPEEVWGRGADPAFVTSGH